ncbi:hypothetical protein HanXRQr2_Chr13g0574611 [Helianthus annuus]|uniref:Uncharacterized protein n=1 Tax=Helianthus annuus TaxID=4232 RepID=A0A251SP15_HELAN|nr:hypothetical protein HanXRQr2_Chr13g0574611 [Helianthus annuus]
MSILKIEHESLDQKVMKKMVNLMKVDLIEHGHNERRHQSLEHRETQAYDENKWNGNYV